MKLEVCVCASSAKGLFPLLPLVNQRIFCSKPTWGGKHPISHVKMSTKQNWRVEQRAISPLPKSSSMNMAELKLQQGKKSQAMELLNKHNAETHNLFWLRKPTATTLGWRPSHAFSSCQGTHVHGLENCFEFFSRVLVAAGNAGGAQRIAPYIGQYFQIMFFFP